MKLLELTVLKKDSTSNCKAMMCQKVPEKFISFYQKSRVGKNTQVAACDGMNVLTSGKVCENNPKVFLYSQSERLIKMYLRTNKYDPSLK